MQDYGVTRIFSPEDGAKLGLQGMINEIVTACDVDLARQDVPALERVASGDMPQRLVALARLITALEAGTLPAAVRDGRWREAGVTRSTHEAGGHRSRTTPIGHRP